MRIAVVSPNLPTPALPMRGVTHFAPLRLFAAAGHDVRAVVPLPWSWRRRLAGTAVPVEERDGEVIVVHPRYPRVPRILPGLERRLFARAAAAALDRPDVVLAHSATLPGGLIGRVSGALFVVAIHDHELYDWAPHNAFVRDAVAGTLRGADLVIYLSHALRRSGIALAGHHRSVVIPTGVETYPGLAAAPPAQFTICAVTRLIARKRVDALMRTFAHLDAGARLVIVGEGPERPALERLARELRIETRVELTGALDARAARERMARASVMALPSVRESLGVVYLEAMSLGVPALGTQGEGIAEHIEHGVSGILVPPGDDAALLAELRALAADPERARRIGAAGRRYIEAGRFSWSDHAAAYLEVLVELVQGRATHTA